MRWCPFAAAPFPAMETPMPYSTVRSLRPAAWCTARLASKRLQMCVIAAAVGACMSFAAGAAELRLNAEPVAGQYIVVLKPALLSAKSGRSLSPSAASVASQARNAYGVEVIHVYEVALRGFAVRADDQALARLLADPQVAYVEEDGIARISDVQSGATWGLDRVDQRDRPLNGTYGYDTTAATVHAYIIDTGIYPDNVDFGGRVSGGFSAVDDGNGTNDCNLHGTHVAGTVGGTRWGVAKQVQLHPVRVLGCLGEGEWSTVIAGIDWVAANHQAPAVANLSLGGSAVQAVDDAIQRLIESGVTTVVAAGNSSADACTFSPARVRAAVTVAATNRNDVRAGFSNFGACVDLFAPGEAITSAGITGPNSTLTIDGTSMASPHVAGAAALYLAANPLATPAQTASAIINASSKGKVSNVSGSPNRLLFSKGMNGINGPIFMDFTASNTGLVARFVDASRSNSGAITTRAWSFGDGGSSTAANPLHVYPRRGIYLVTETVSDNAGYVESLTRSITIR